MIHYIALIRGINVGGNNKVSMLELRQGFATAGFTDVSTYINSGNVIFKSDIEDITSLVETCERILREQFSVTTRVAVIAVADFHVAAKQAPTWWNADPDSRHNALFVIAPASTDEVIREIGEIKPEYESVAQYGSVIFWTAQLKHLTRTRWSRIVGTAAYRNVTVRNANTVAKLVSLTS